MNKKLELPNNDQMYYKSALESYKLGDYEKSILFFKKIDKMKFTIEILYYYILTLCNLREYEQALDLYEQHQNVYDNSLMSIDLYIYLLIKNNKFIHAEYMIQRKKKLYLNNNNFEEDYLTNHFEDEKDKIHTYIQRKRNQIRNDLANITNFSLERQIKIVRSSSILELKDLQPLAVFILKNPYIASQVKNGYLELLITKNDTNKYHFNWLNEYLEIDLNKVTLFSNNTLVKKLDQMLEEKLYKNPSMIYILKNEILNDLMILYPFIEKIVIDEDYWVDLYIMLFDRNYTKSYSYSTNKSEQKKMNSWFKKMNIIANRS